MAKKTKQQRRRSTRGERRSHRRRISQEKNLSLGTRSSLTKGETGHYSRHIRTADLAENIPENTVSTVVLDIYRTPWSWTYRSDPGRDTTENTTGKWSRKGYHREHHGPIYIRGKHEKGTVTETTRSYEGRPGQRDSNQGRSCYYHSFIREDSHSSVVSFGQTPQLTEENAVITADIIGGESHIRFERGVQSTGALGE